jgi:hypothetical protein
MFIRTTALLLAVLMLWSGVAVTEQRFAEALDLPGQAASASGESKRSDLVGSMDDHVVDDQPAQPFGDLASDLPALLDTTASTNRCAAVASFPIPHSGQMRPPPCLEGLQRPPACA